MKHSAAAPTEWNADVPPQLVASYGSHLWLGERLSKILFPDIVITPDPTEIEAPVDMVWEVLLDFERYGEWNGFHRKIEIVDQPGGTVGLRSAQ